MEDYRKLNNQPLRFVLAEFRFSQVMDIQSFIPKIQESLRRQYPTTENKKEQMVHIQLGSIATSGIDHWSFTSANKKNAIEINQDRLIYYTSDYPRFEAFSDACEKALNVISDIVEPSLIRRIGLRYGDLVKIEDNDKASDLVDASFIYPDCIGKLGSASHQKTETFINTELGGLAIRSLYGIHNLTCLPDIRSLPIDIALDDTTSERIVLDFDHFWEAKHESTLFKTAEILTTLELLHKISRKAFWQVTTDYARNKRWA
ncbi:TIGR04255 family protein [Porticoccaceae bacterium]|nr:TIGR04255 family protein [Porticoccaceae bacterium]